MPDTLTPTPERASRPSTPSPRQPPAPLLTLRDGLPAVVETDDGAPRGLRRARRRHRPGRDRRRARLGLPLLHPRLPHPAAPRGRRHLAHRPDRARRPWPRCRRRSRAPSGSCTPPPRTCPACAEVGLRPDRAVRHRARRAAARLPPGRPGHPGRDRARPPDAQGALRRRLVDPPAARAVARVRRARRRGARRAARRPGRRAGGGRQGRVGPPGVRPPAAASSPPCASRRGVVRRGCTGCAAAARLGVLPARCGRPATRSPPSATSPRAGSSRTPRSSPPPPRCPPTAARS